MGEATEMNSSERRRDSFHQARRFMYTEARLLERLLFAVRFEGAPAEPVGALIRAYQNPDGGLGHALEPDLRCPESQPLFVGVGLQALRDAGLRDRDLSLRLCSFLESVSDDSGFVPLILPSALHWPRAAHWSSLWEPGINPTAEICGLLHYQGVEHPWLERATRACCDVLLHEPPREAHALLSAVRLVEHLPDRELAGALAERIADALPDASFFVASAPVTQYGLTPLHLAPAPNSPMRRFFTQEQIDAHLADLAARQQEDGGWPITWDPPPGQAPRSEWRGRMTFEAISCLAAYGWIDCGETRSQR